MQNTKEAKMPRTNKYYLIDAILNFNHQTGEVYSLSIY